MKQKWGLVLFSISLCLFLFASAWKYYEADQGVKIKTALDQSKELLIPSYAPQIGSQNPQIELVEFLDPQCESCRAFHPFTKHLVKKYGDKLRLTIRYAPFHEHSRFAIKVLEGARAQGKYWEALDILFKYQPYWGPHHGARPELIWTFLEKSHIDIEKIKKNMDNPQHDKLIKKELETLEKLGVRMTPSFFVNGEKLKEFGKESLEKLINAHQ